MFSEETGGPRFRHLVFNKRVVPYCHFGRVNSPTAPEYFQGGLKLSVFEYPIFRFSDIQIPETFMTGKAPSSMRDFLGANTKTTDLSTPGYRALRCDARVLSIFRDMTDQSTIWGTLIQQGSNISRIPETTRIP